MGDSDNENNNDFFDPEEELDIGGHKILNLQDVAVKSGEEEEDLIFKGRARLYRWRDNDWKERGTGDAKLLRHKTTKKIRFILRQDKTLKAVANFIVSNEDPLCLLKAHQESDKMFIFPAYDCSEDQHQFEKFVIKLGNAELANKFKESFTNAREFNKAVKEGKEKEAKWADVIVEEKDNNIIKEEKNKEIKEEKNKEEDKITDK